MFLTTIAAAASGLLLSSGFSTSPGSPAERPVPPARAVRASARPDGKKLPPAAPGTLLLAREGGLVVLTPEGKEGRELAPSKGARSTFHGRLSPDGARAALAVNKRSLGAPERISVPRGRFRWSSASPARQRRLP